MSSRLRHHGVPGLQAQKWVNTENTTASTIVIGITLVIVWPSISTTSRARLDMAAPHLIRDLRVTRPCLKSHESRPAARSRCLHIRENPAMSERLPHHFAL